MLPLDVRYIVRTTYAHSDVVNKYYSFLDKDAHALD